MFLLPLQPLPGAPSVQLPDHSGLLDIGTGFRDMLQNAQHQFDAEGAPALPMPERPKLAALMADLLDGAESGGDTPKQIMSVLVPEAEGPQVAPLSAQSAKFVPVVSVEGEEDGAGEFALMGKPLLDETGLEDVAQDMVSLTPVSASEASGAALKANGEQVRQGVSPYDLLAVDRRLQGGRNMLASARRELPTVALEDLASDDPDSPLPIFRRTDNAPSTEVLLQSETPKTVGSNGGVAQVGQGVSQPRFVLDALSDEDAEIDIESSQNMVSETQSQARFLSEEDASDSELSVALKETIHTHNANGQDGSLYVAQSPIETQSILPSDQLVQVDKTVDAGVVEKDLADVEQTPRFFGRDVRQNQPQVTPQPLVENRVSGSVNRQSITDRVNVSSFASARAEKQVMPPALSRPQTPILSQEEDVQERASENDVIPSQTPISQPHSQQNVSRTVSDQTSQVVGQKMAMDLSGEIAVSNFTPRGAVPEPDMSKTSRTSVVSRSDESVDLGTQLDAGSGESVSESDVLGIARSSETSRSFDKAELGAQPNRVSRESVSESAVLSSARSQEVPRSSEQELLGAQPNRVSRESVSESAVLSSARSQENVRPLVSERGAIGTPSQSFEQNGLAQPQVKMPSSPQRGLMSSIGQNGDLQQRRFSEMQNESVVLPQSPIVDEVQNKQTLPLPSALHTSQQMTSSEMQNGTDINPVVLPQTPIETVENGISQVPMMPEETTTERSVVSEQAPSVAMPENVITNKEIQPAETKQTSRLVFSQPLETVSHKVVSEKVDLQQPVVTQSQQPVAQDSVLPHPIQAPAVDDEAQRSVDELDRDVETFSEGLENSTIISSDSQTNDGAGREQHNAPHQPVVAPSNSSDNTASVAFGGVVEPEMALPNIEQRVDTELQNIERMPEHPEMRIDMVHREGTGTEVARGQLDTMPSEQIDRHYGVGEQVVRNARVMMRAGNTEVTMRIDPQELGEVTIRLSSHDQKVSGEIVVENQKVQEIVQRHLSTLRDALAGQGIQIENIDVSVNDRGNQADREAFREGLEDRSQNREQRQQPRSESRWDQAEKRQRQTSDGQVDFMA